jgi:hypothetical protein
MNQSNSGLVLHRNSSSKLLQLSEEEIEKLIRQAQDKYSEDFDYEFPPKVIQNLQQIPPGNFPVSPQKPDRKSRRFFHRNSSKNSKKFSEKTNPQTIRLIVTFLPTSPRYILYRLLLTIFILTCFYSAIYISQSKHKSYRQHLLSNSNRNLSSR